MTIAFGLASCKMYAVKKYHLQKQQLDHDKKTYRAFIHTKSGVDYSNVIYLDSLSYYTFLKETYISSTSPILLGCYVNDSAIIKTSNFFNENTSCSGRIEQEIEASLQVNGIELQKRTVFPRISSYRFRFIESDSLFFFNKPQKSVTVFLAISSSFGSYYDDLYKSINRLFVAYKDKMNLYFIVVDPFWKLK